MIKYIITTNIEPLFVTDDEELAKYLITNKIGTNYKTINFLSLEAFNGYIGGQDHTIIDNTNIMLDNPKHNIELFVNGVLKYKISKVLD